MGRGQAERGQGDAAGGDHAALCRQNLELEPRRSCLLGPDGSFEGVSKGGDAVGIGKWYVTRKGKLCNEADWHQAVDGVVKTVSNESCWQFVTAPDGSVWERYLGGDGSWYRHKPEKQVSGNSQRRLFRKISKRLGL
ncbi:DUF995 domain-containing protein [Leisingera sp. S132]|uniref:DUF995 domain-containing protein n=1 Tax=Leisingera sp. S132 TaxID=2867016 RepID=UPI0021A8A9B9|nr:DUF995 domain-containing protein [Leisingera sp. S132]UWQ78149.1 DUF995 domain-containing protein [Leisingera sp. S132]